MDPTQQSAADYYNKHRKHSLFSRITIFSSMVVLLVILGINVSVLSSQDKSTVKSNASTPENVEKLLPSLPPGCVYHHIQEKVQVDCPTPTPAATATSLNINLPQLPPGCAFAPTASGSALRCTSPHGPIPASPLPSLPAGCVYTSNGSQYFVVCDAR